MAAKKFVCKVCGYVHEGSSAPSVCPLCKAPASEFEVVKENKKKGINTNSDMWHPAINLANKVFFTGSTYLK